MILLASVPVCIGIRASDDTLGEAGPAGDSFHAVKAPPLTKREQFKIYNEKTGYYAGFAIDSVLLYGPTALALAKELREKEAERTLYHHIGVAYDFRGNYDSAFICYDKARAIDVATGDRPGEAATLSLMIFSYARQGKYVTAIDYSLEVLAIYESIEEQRNRTYINALTNLSELYRRMNSPGMAIQYLDRAAELCEELEKDIHYMLRMAHINNEYAANYLEQGNLEKALEYALKADNTEHGIINKCNTKWMLASIYLRLGESDRALQSAMESLELADILKDKVLYMDVRKVLSDIYLAQGRYPEAESEALEAWQADSTRLDESRVIALNIALANIYMHDAGKAAYYLRKYSEMNRKYSEKSFHNTVSELTIKYETEKKEMRISSLERQKILYVSINLIGVLLALALWIVFRQKIRSERKEKQLAAARAMLEGEKEERKRLARDLHDGLGGMLSLVKLGVAGEEHLQHLNGKIDLCIKELRRIAHHLTPFSLAQSGLKVALEDYCFSFSNVRFHFYGEDRRFDEQIELVVYYCVCELVNNSIKHARATGINVQLILTGEQVTLTVQDDGCGFDKSLQTQGAGLKNIADRIAIFNGKMDIITSPGNGTETNIEMSCL
ncbi:MAG: tetratricopeptide repeat protein [Tannerella sp.]|jgi:signal transduction histidine kinase|nr:tetratricopeptide repeat protein [Tannerella sp.]